MKFLSLSTAFVVFALATPVLPAQPPRATDRVTEITSTELRRAPENFKGVNVRFPAQFCATGRVFNPFLRAGLSGISGESAEATKGPGTC
jgi:hypothetical protein